MTVPPPLIAANRAQLMALIATNIFGQNTPAIMATEAHYSEMWAQDATAMYGYAASSAAASAFDAVHVAATDHQSGRADRRSLRRPPAPRSAASVQIDDDAVDVLGAASPAEIWRPPDRRPRWGSRRRRYGAAPRHWDPRELPPRSVRLSSLTGATGKGATKSAGTGAGWRSPA